MKSIKEKAQEWADIYPSCGMADKSFTEGANYVLEQIEKLANNQNWCAFPKQSHKELKELIKQLKSNQ